MLAYKENIKLESNKLVIELPDDFVGRELEISIIENSINNGNNEKIHNFKRMMKPYENEFMIEGNTFRRENIYD